MTDDVLFQGGCSTASQEPAGHVRTAFLAFSWVSTKMPAQGCSARSHRGRMRSGWRRPLEKRPTRYSQAVEGRVLFFQNIVRRGIIDIVVVPINW